MQRVTLEEVETEPNPLGVNRERRDLGSALDTDHVAVVHYELAPGESFSGGLHTHHDQEELFYVLQGTATFEYRPPADEEAVAADDGAETEAFQVSAGEAIRFAPGEFQCGRNRSDDTVVGLAIAAPGSRHEWSEIESLAPCGECGEVTPHGVRVPDGGFVVYCEACGHEIQVA